MNELNMVEMLRNGVEAKVKEVVTDKLVAEQLKTYEEELRKTIKPMVENISFKEIKKVADLVRLRDEVHVYLHWDDEQKTQVTRKV